MDEGYHKWDTMKNNQCRTKRKIIAIFIFLNCILLLLLPYVSGIPECEYGVFDVWMSLDGNHWMNTTLTNISCNRGQLFYIKAMMKSTKEDVWGALYLFEPGATSNEKQSFIVLEGPCNLNEGCDLGQLTVNESKTVCWTLKVRNQPEWIGGFTPVSISCFFQKKIKESWDTEEISFSIASIYLNETEWSSLIYSSMNESTTNESLILTNSIALILLSILVILIAIINVIRKRNKNKDH